VQNAQVLFPVNVEGPFDYEVPFDMELSRGSFVFAPLGQQHKLGVVWGLNREKADRPLKSVSQKKACPNLPDVMLDFVDWTARYSCASPGMVLRMVMSSYKALNPSPMVTQFTPLDTASVRPRGSSF